MSDQSRDALDRYWDDLVRDRPSTPGALDPALAEAVRTFHAAQDVDGPSPAFVARLQEDLMLAQTALAAPAVLSPNGFAQVTPRPGRPRPVPVASHHGPRRPRALHSLAAAILVAALIATLVAALDPGFRRSDRTNPIPAASLQDATPSPSATSDETLAQITLPSGSLPSGARSSVTAALLTIPAGSVEPWTRGSALPGPNVTLVLEGSATLSAGADISILRAGASTVETIPPTAGMPITAGDLLLLREDLTWSLTATGDGPVRLLSTWVLGTSSIGVDLYSWMEDDLDSVDDLTLSSDPVTVRFQRLQLEPNGSVPPDTAIVHLALALPSEQARLARASDNTIRNAGPNPQNVYVVSFLPANPSVPVTRSGTEPSPLPDGVTADQTLVAVTLAADVLANGDAAEVGMSNRTVPAGSTTVWTGDEAACCSGPSIYHVLDGSSIFTPGATAHILRAGTSDPAAIAAGVAVEVERGDTVIARDEFPWEWTVTGTAPMQLITSWVLITSSLPSPDLATWSYGAFEIIHPVALPAQPLTFELRRVTLAAGATLSPDSAIVQLAVEVPGTLARISTLSGGGVKNVGADPADIYVLTLTPAGPDAMVVLPGAAASPVAATPEP